MAAKKLVSMRLSEAADEQLTELAAEQGISESEILAEAIKDIYGKRQEEKRRKTLSKMAAATLDKYLPDTPAAGWLWVWLKILQDEIDKLELSRAMLADNAEDTLGIEPEVFEYFHNEITDWDIMLITKAVKDILAEFLNELNDANLTR